MRTWEKTLSVLESLRERGETAGHGLVLDTEVFLTQRENATALEKRGLVELAGREDRAELSAWEGRPVRWGARLTPYGHDTLAYARSRPQPAPSPGGTDPHRRLVSSPRRR